MSRKILVDDDAAQYDSINQRLRRLEQGIPELPHYVGTAGEPAFENSWSNFDASPAPVGRAAFYYRHNGRVYLGGVIDGGASGSTAFTLPVGYRPPIVAVSLPAVASTDLALIGILADGTVRPTNQGSSAVTTWCYLEGVSFRHA